MTVIAQFGRDMTTLTGLLSGTTQCALRLPHRGTSGTVVYVEGSAIRPEPEGVALVA